MLLTFKTQLNLSDEQQTIVDAMSNDGRMLYNHFLGKLKEQYEKDKTFISYYKQQKELKDYKCEYLTFDVKKEILIIENYFNYICYEILLIICITPEGFGEFLNYSRFYTEKPPLADPYFLVHH